MFYPLSSSLILFFLLSLFNHLPYASSNQGHGWCESLFQCGNITTGFPFWGGNRQKLCGHPLLELHCKNNITSLFISSQEFHVLAIDQTSKTLTLARTDHLGSFCSSSFNTTNLSSQIFEFSPTYKNLTVFYNCAPELSYPSSFTCPALGHLSMSKSQNSCKDSFRVNVPMSFVPEEKELNVTRLESVLRKGFEVKLIIDEQPCRKCLSTHGICGFNSTTQICCNVASSSGGVSCIPYQPSADEIYRRCGESFSCGNQEYLSYPLWIPGREECGHPDFKLDCSGEFAEININFVKFRILEMQYYPSGIRLARSEYIDDICPTNPMNAPFFKSVPPFYTDAELLTLYYECNSSLPDISAMKRYVGDLGCDGGRSYYVMEDLYSPLLNGFKGLLNNFRATCKRNVSVPASGSTLKTLQESPNQYNLKKALEEGFYLYNTDCTSCQEHGGVCGYNQTSSSFVCYCEDGRHDVKCRSNVNDTSITVVAAVIIIIVIGMFSLAGFVTFLVLLCPCVRVQIFRKRKTSDARRQKKLKALIPLKHYTYAKVKKMTKSFAEVIGKGGFGIVYKGTLCDGRMVAVKVLKESKGNNGEDFINEVASMSKTSHVNIVSLLGFCSEGSKRAIIYEFLENGSLDKFISDKTSMNLDFKTMYGIALGVARGLEYLHYGCKTRILHFDIKPQNVLLDDKFCPKVSDFGLAKLCEKNESILSSLDTRGTVGYIAPEMISRAYGSVSHKSDVYSYGMLVLEMIGAKNKERFDQNSESNASSMYFPEWIYKDLEKGDSGRRLIENVVSSDEEKIVKKMTLVGLWCIQSSPLNRPPMNRVVEMIEGNVEDLEVPPRPVFQQTPATLLSESFSIAEESSSASQILISSTN